MANEQRNEEQGSPFGEVTLSASIPGLPFSQMHITVKEGVNPFVAAKRFKDRFIETFGAEAVAEAVAASQAGQRVSAPAAEPSGPPKCPVHNVAMKASRKPGSWYCSKKVGDDYCTEKVGA